MDALCQAFGYALISEKQKKTYAKGERMGRDKRRENLLTGIIGFFLIFAVVSGTTYATVPGTINYQGFLANSSGDPFDGTREMTFKICSDNPPTPTPCALEWSETHSSVTVTSGIFSVILGSVDPGTNPIDPSVLNGDRWLEVVVEDEALSPRQKLTSAA